MQAVQAVRHWKAFSWPRTTTAPLAKTLYPRLLPPICPCRICWNRSVHRVYHLFRSNLRTDLKYLFSFSLFLFFSFSLFHLFICSFVHLLICSFLRLFVCSFVQQAGNDKARLRRLANGVCKVRLVCITLANDNFQSGGGVSANTFDPNKGEVHSSRSSHGGIYRYVCV